MQRNHFLKDHPELRPNPLERSLVDVNQNRKVLITTSDQRLSHLKGHFPCAKGLASQEGFHCTHSDVTRGQCGTDRDHVIACSWMVQIPGYKTCCFAVQLCREPSGTQSCIDSTCTRPP